MDSCHFFFISYLSPALGRKEMGEIQSCLFGSRGVSSFGSFHVCFLSLFFVSSLNNPSDGNAFRIFAVKQ